MNDAQIRKIIATFTREPIVSIKQIANRGLVNEVYKFTTESGKYIIRIDPEEPSIKRFEKEAWCIKAGSEAGIPGTEVEIVGSTETGNPFMILSYVGEIDGDQADPMVQSKIWKTLGGYARKIHQINVNGYGDRMTTDGVFADSWEGFLNYNLSCLTSDDPMVKMGFITENESMVLREVFENISRKVFTFGLTHHDISLKNTRVGAEGTVYLIDWGSACVSIVPHTEFAEILGSSISGSSAEFALFLSEYGMTVEQFKTILPEIHQLDLLMMTDKVRWALDKKPDLIQEKLSEFREAFRRVVA